MPTDAEWYWLARDRCRALAVQMVRLERLAQRYELESDYVKADQVWWDRDGVRQERSQLLREIWARRQVSVPRSC